MNALQTALTGRDNQSTDIGRVLWAVVTGALCGLQGWAVARGQAFDPVSFSTGAAAVLAAGGVGLAVKAKTEPGT